MSKEATRNTRCRGERAPRTDRQDPGREAGSPGRRRRSLRDPAASGLLLEQHQSRHQERSYGLLPTLCTDARRARKNMKAGLSARRSQVPLATSRCQPACSCPRAAARAGDDPFRVRGAAGSTLMRCSQPTTRDIARAEGGTSTTAGRQQFQRSPVVGCGQDAALSSVGASQSIETTSTPCSQRCAV